VILGRDSEQYRVRHSLPSAAGSLADASQLKQDVRLRDFAYDSSRSFRAWLKTVAHHALIDFVEARQRPGHGSGDSAVLERLHTVEAREDLLARLGEAFDRELLEAAVLRVRLRVAPQTWEAFRLTAEDGLSGAEAAGRIGMQVAQVFVARRRVQKMLQEEVARLDAGEEDNAR
jgi:DNA-directed RNA polymerase specialized sigma24 family protein